MEVNMNKSCFLLSLLLVPASAVYGADASSGSNQADQPGFFTGMYNSVFGASTTSATEPISSAGQSGRISRVYSGIVDSVVIGLVKSSGSFLWANKGAVGVAATALGGAAKGGVSSLYNGAKNHPKLTLAGGTLALAVSGAGAYALRNRRKRALARQADPVAAMQADLEDKLDGGDAPEAASTFPTSDTEESEQKDSQPTSTEDAATAPAEEAKPGLLARAFSKVFSGLTGNMQASAAAEAQGSETTDTVEEEATSEELERQEALKRSQEEETAQRQAIAAAQAEELVQQAIEAAQAEELARQEREVAIAAAQAEELARQEREAAEEALAHGVQSLYDAYRDGYGPDLLGRVSGDSPEVKNAFIVSLVIDLQGSNDKNNANEDILRGIIGEEADNFLQARVRAMLRRTQENSDERLSKANTLIQKYSN